MTENDAGRRPSGPPPSRLGAGLPAVPVQPEAAERNEPSEEVRPAGGARATTRRIGNSVGALVAIAALVAIVFVFGRPYVAQWFGGADAPSTTMGEGEENVYDFTQTVSTESPLGPMPEVTIRVPDGLASVVPGYADGRYLDAVTVSNVQYLESRDREEGYSESLDLVQLYCSMDISFDWHEGVLERELADSTVDADKVAGLVGLSLAHGFDAFEFSDDWSKATATTRCYDPAEVGSLRKSMSFAFRYEATNGLGAQEVKQLAVAPVLLTSNGKVFIVEGATEPNLLGWSVDGDGQWSEAYGQ